MNTSKNKSQAHKALPLEWVRKFSYYLVLLVLMVFFAIYLSTNFHYTLVTMEGDDFWVLTWGFWQLKLCMLPAATNWLADYLRQFFALPYISVAIFSFVLGSIALITHNVLTRLTDNRWHLGWLGLLPSILLGYYCTFDLSLQLQCLFFLGMLQVFMLIPDIKGKFLWSILCVPLGFLLMRTPLLFLLLLAQAVWTYKSHKVKKSLYWILPVLMVALAPLVYSQQVAFIPFEERYTSWGGKLEPITSLNSLAGEYVKKLVCLSNEQRWEDLLYKERVRNDAQRGKTISLRYALLAESALGTLPENLLDYPINDENLFFYPHQTEYVALQFNRLFYLNLGIYDEAFHHAEEYGLLHPNGNNFSSLRQMVDYSIEEGEWEIADKYLHILSKSSCHKDFIKERRTMMENAKKYFSKDIPLRGDNFVGGYPLPIEMLRFARYYKDSPHRKKMVDYAICSYMLRGDINKFLIALKAFDFYKDKELPRAYREFLEAHQSQSN